MDVGTEHFFVLGNNDVIPKNRPLSEEWLRAADEDLGDVDGEAESGEAADGAEDESAEAGDGDGAAGDAADGGAADAPEAAPAEKS